LVPSVVKKALAAPEHSLNHGWLGSLQMAVAFRHTPLMVVREAYAVPHEIVTSS